MAVTRKITWGNQARAVIKADRKKPNFREQIMGEEMALSP